MRICSAAAAAVWEGNLFERLQRRVDTEKLLQWAFRQELPKRRIAIEGPEYLTPLSRIIDLGTLVDEKGLEEPGLPAHLGAPHPDALAIERAVAELEDVAVDWPGTRRALLDDLAGLLDESDVTLSALVVGLVGLVALHARMGTRPRWDYWAAPEPIIGRNGKPVVQFLDDRDRLVEGRRNKNFGRLSRCPLMWFPAPREAAYGRIEYTIWAETLDELALTLAGQLEDYDALPPQLPRAPWRAKA
jgi:hypothetical protein